VVYAVVFRVGIGRSGRDASTDSSCAVDWSELVPGRHLSRRSTSSRNEATMTAITKAGALRVIRRAYGPDRAESLAGRLEDRVDLEDAAHVRVLSELALTRDGLFDELGAEL